MWIPFLLVVGIVGACVLLLGIRILFVKDGKFPNTHIENNKALRGKGIHCATTQDKIEYKK